MFIRNNLLVAATAVAVVAKPGGPKSTTLPFTAAPVDASAILSDTFAKGNPPPPYAAAGIDLAAPSAPAPGDMRNDGGSLIDGAKGGEAVVAGQPAEAEDAFRRIYIASTQKATPGSFTEADTDSSGAVDATEFVLHISRLGLTSMTKRHFTMLQQSIVLVSEGALISKTRSSAAKVHASIARAIQRIVSLTETAFVRVDSDSNNLITEAEWASPVNERAHIAFERNVLKMMEMTNTKVSPIITENRAESDAAIKTKPKNKCTESMGRDFQVRTISIHGSKLSFIGEQQSAMLSWDDKNQWWWGQMSSGPVALTKRVPLPLKLKDGLGRRSPPIMACIGAGPDECIKSRLQNTDVWLRDASIASDGVILTIRAKNGTPSAISAKLGLVIPVVGLKIDLAFSAIRQGGLPWSTSC